MGARLFTAVLPPADLVEELDHFLTPRRQAEPRLRWTRPEGWHLTTAFMASVTDDGVDRLTEALAEVAARTPAFRLRLGGDKSPAAAVQFQHQIEIRAVNLLR
mgnify:CR=1 FL=1